MARAFFATRHTAADVQEALCLDLLASALRVWEVRVTTINNDISFLEVRQELLNECIDCCAGLDEQDNFARTLEQ